MKKNILDNLNWKPPEDWMTIKTIDMHTGGEPLRVFTEGLPEIPGKSILDKRKYFREHYDDIRTAIMWEPRGHADMYGAIITEPTTPDGDFGVFFMHNEGYSTMCGHAIIALTKLVLETGIIVKTGKNPVIKIDAPPGRIESTAVVKDGIVKKVTFRNVPSFLLMRDQSIDISGIGKIDFDVAYGGAFYAFCEARDLGLNLDKSDYGKIIDFGKRIKKAVNNNFSINHPYEPDLNFLYGTIFTGNPYDYSHHSRNVCVFAEGEVDRSATGSGVSARAALHYAKKELNVGEKITVESILGTTMDVKIIKSLKYDIYDAVIPEVTGSAEFTGQNRFYLNPDDPLKDGFIFR